MYKYMVLLTFIQMLYYYAKDKIFVGCFYLEDDIIGKKVNQWYYNCAIHA